MAPSVGTNTFHHIAQFRTRPWRDPEGNLNYYDFAASALRKESPNKLFASPGPISLNTRLNRMVEQPLQGLRKKSSVSHPKTWRALHLAFFIQFIANQGEKGYAELEELLSDDAHMDSFAACVADKYYFMQLPTNPRCPLMYPSNGFFMMPLPDLKGMVWCMPHGPLHVTAMVHKHQNADLVLKTAAFGGGASLSNYSVGNTDKLVVIHPAVLENDDLVRHLEEARQEFKNRLEMIEKAHDLIGQAYAAVGIVLQ